MTDASTVDAKSHLDAADAEQFKKLCEQVWFAYVTTKSPILLSTHQELNELRVRITGEDE